MDVFALASWSLVIVAAVTLIWPVNILFAALAYKVSRGPKALDLEAGEFWFRCTLAALGLCAFSVILVGLLYASIHIAAIPAGPVQVVLLLIYLTSAVPFLSWSLAVEDLLQALGIFLLYILLPGLPLLLLGWMTGFWETIRRSAPWLLLPS